MEDERNTQSHQGGEADQVEVTDRGFFNHLVGKKEEKVEEQKHEEELAAGMEKVSVEEPAEVKKEEHEGGEKHESLLTKLQWSSSSSSSDEEEEEEVIDDSAEVIKRKKKKGLKEKLKEKLPSHKDTTKGELATGLPAPATPAALQTHHDTAVPVEKIDGDVKAEAPAAAVPEEEKKGFLEKIKEKLPGGHKKPEDAAAAAPAVTHAAPAPPAPAPAAEEVSSPDGKEKKGLLGKIMDKLPGYHKAAGEEDKAAAPAGDHKTSA
ncbi:hypothetical protein ACQ4PT_043129 [Festuca glaucescens]